MSNKLSLILQLIHQARCLQIQWFLAHLNDRTFLTVSCYVIFMLCCWCTCLCNFVAKKLGKKLKNLPINHYWLFEIDTMLVWFNTYLLLESLIFISFKNPRENEFFPISFPKVLVQLKNCLMVLIIWEWLLCDSIWMGDTLLLQNKSRTHYIGSDVLRSRYWSSLSSQL